MFTERNSDSDRKILATQEEAAIMQLQTGRKGEMPGTMAGLTDLFIHLSHLENSRGMDYEVRDEAFMAKLLDTYLHLPQEIKDDIMAYVRNPCQETVDPIKKHASDEVQKMWDLVGMC
jgi:hypothetical protein